MSRIGKLPIEIPEGVTVEIKDGIIKIKGPKGELEQKLHEKINVQVEENQILCKRKSDDKEARSLHGLMRNLIANMVEGVTAGFNIRLEIIGVGYKVQAQGSKATLNLGFSHPITVNAPEGVTFDIDKEKKNILIVSGIDKQAVGEVAANIRAYRKPEPYKGKGIRYEGEYVPRKVGKAVGKAE
jgi:large subunit ribosomal protein L6